MSDRERRIHELTYSCESRTEMCERVIDMEDECERLRERFENVYDECERLRSCLSDAGENARLIMAENARLRELAYVSLNYCANGYCSPEDGCPMNTVDGKGLCGYVRTCRELGIKEDS